MSISVCWNIGDVDKCDLKEGWIEVQDKLWKVLTSHIWILSCGKPLKIWKYRREWCFQRIVNLPALCDLGQERERGQGRETTEAVALVQIQGVPHLGRWQMGEVTKRESVLFVNWIFWKKWGGRSQRWLWSSEPKSLRMLVPLPAVGKIKMATSLRVK